MSLGLKVKPRQETSYIVVHASLTRQDQELDLKALDRKHRARGLLRCGYHFVICRNGQVQEGRPLEAPGYHVPGFNDMSVGICLIGGFDEEGRPDPESFTQEQKDALRGLVERLKEIYPDAEVLGHCDLDTIKDCPCFCVVDFLMNNNKKGS